MLDPAALPAVGATSGSSVPSGAGLDWPILITAAVAIIAAALGSTVLSTVLTGRATRSAERLRQRRKIVRYALEALGASQAVVNRVGDAPASVRPQDVVDLAARNIELETAIALTGDRASVTAARAFRRTSEDYISGVQGVNAPDQRAQFERLIDLLADIVGRESGRL